MGRGRWAGEGPCGARWRPPVRRQRRRYMATRTDDVGGAGRQRAAAHSMGGTGGIVGHGTGSAAERAKKDPAQARPGPG